MSVQLTLLRSSSNGCLLLGGIFDCEPFWQVRDVEVGMVSRQHKLLSDNQILYCS
jgi:hypothetical protein